MTLQTQPLGKHSFFETLSKNHWENLVNFGKTILANEVHRVIPHRLPEEILSKIDRFTDQKKKKQSPVS